MTAVTVAADLGAEHIEQEVRIAAEGQPYGALSGALGLVVQMPDDGLTTLALWRDDRCVQVTIPSQTKATIRTGRA